MSGYKVIILMLLILYPSSCRASEENDLWLLLSSYEDIGITTKDLAFFPIVFHRHAGVLALGIQLGIRESHADRKRHVFSRVKYESPLPNFYLEGGALPQKSGYWLLINDCCLSPTQRLAGVGHKAKPLLQGLARGRRIQRKSGRLLCGYFSLSRGTAGQEDEQGNDAYSLHDIFGVSTYR